MYTHWSVSVLVTCASFNATHANHWDVLIIDKWNPAWRCKIYTWYVSAHICILRREGNPMGDGYRWRCNKIPTYQESRQRNIGGGKRAYISFFLGVSMNGLRQYGIIPAPFRAVSVSVVLLIYSWFPRFPFTIQPLMVIFRGQSLSYWNELSRCSQFTYPTGK